jgi:hypothetical protein
MLEQMKRLCELFAGHVSDQSTLQELLQLIGDRGAHQRGHDLFRRIRSKTLEASRRGDKCAECQYLFEEVCAQTLYNLSGAPAPFDGASPYWIVPNALSLARRLGIDECAITSLVAG